MKFDALPYYRWLVRDCRARRKVQRMGYIARGFYRELLDEEWLEGSIPNDLAALADICGCPVKVMEKAWVEISPCFKEVDGRLVNEKLESLRTVQDTLRVKRIEAGRLGGIAKQVVADAKQLLASATAVESTCHIAEQREQSTSRAFVDASEAEDFDNEPSLAARMLSEACGNFNMKFQADRSLQIKAEAAKRGMTCKAVADLMISAWEKYNASRSKLNYPVSAADKFWSSGTWHDQTYGPGKMAQLLRRGAMPCWRRHNDRCIRAGSTGLRGRGALDAGLNPTG
jgi:hypothetical protein